MIYDENSMEQRAVLDAAARMCAAARTSPKTKGMDGLKTCVVTNGDKQRLADHMRELGAKFNYDFFIRDAANVEKADAVVLFGMAEVRRGLNEGCQYCHFKNCGECARQDGLCAWDAMDIGIALGSAVSTAADMRVDNRIMFSVGRTAMDLGFLPEGTTLVIGIPLSVSGKSPFFDRKKST